MDNFRHDNNESRCALGTKTCITSHAACVSLYHKLPHPTLLAKKNVAPGS